MGDTNTTKTAIVKTHTVGKHRSKSKLNLHERHRKYVSNDTNKCSPPVAVTAGIAGANLISQGEVSLVVCERGVLTMHDCKHALYPNQVSPQCLISLQKLVTNPQQRVGRTGEQREEAVMREQGGGAAAGDGSSGG